MTSSIEQQTTNEKLIRLPEVLEIIPVSRAHWLDGVKRGIYPEPIKLGMKLNFWRLSDIQKLLNGGTKT
ncbi:MAG: helix-turn-helix transcriptional regulator [Hyphomicrobiaceae bacterium]